MRRTPAEMSSSEKIYEIPSQRRRLTARAFPTRESQLKERFSASFGAPGARQGQVSFDARPGRSRRRLLPARKQSARMQQRCRWRPGRRPKKTGTMGQSYSFDAFFSYPTIIYFKPESPVPSAPCTTCGSRGASKEKKVWVHGFLCRERPAWWGALAENETRTYSSTSNISCEKSSWAIISTISFSFLRPNINPSHFTHRSFFFDIIKKHQIIL